MGKKKPARLSGNTVSGFATLLASLECIVLGLVVGYIALLILGAITAAQGGSAMTFGELLKTTWEKGFKAILQGGFFKTANTLGMGGLEDHPGGSPHYDRPVRGLRLQDRPL